MKRMVNQQRAKINNPCAFYRVRLEELEGELEELRDTRQEMSLKFDKYLGDVEKVIERQEKDAPYIKSRLNLVEKKKNFVKALQEIDPKWRQKVNLQKELELQNLRKLSDKLRSNNFKKVEDVMIQKQLENEIDHTKNEIMNNIQKAYN